MVENRYRFVFGVWDEDENKRIWPKDPNELDRVARGLTERDIPEIRNVLEWIESLMKQKEAKGNGKR